MKAQYKLKGGKIVIEVEAEKMTDLFESLTHIEDVFGNEKCELCQSTEVKYVVRQNKDEDKFYEMQCTKCGGKLALSVNKGKEGTMYAVKKLNKTTGLPAKVSDEGPFDWDKKGWHKYDKNKVGVNSSSNTKTSTSKK
jgi:hypothetical protein